MKKLVISVTILGLLTTGCAGVFREKANPVQAYQYGDDAKTCSELEKSLVDCKADYTMWKHKRQGTLIANTIIGVTGALILPALMLTMDLSGDDAVERDAQAERYEMLTKISVGKKCTFKIPKLATAKETKPHAPTNDH